MKKPTIADWFSLYRIIAVPLLIFTLIKRRRKKFIYLSAASLFTDAADGFFARQLKQETKQGAKLDSTGDLLTQLLMVVGLFRFKKSFLQDHKTSILSIVGVYILQIAAGYLKYKKLTTFHTYSSKIAFIALGIFYILLFLYKYIRTLYKVSVLLMMISLIEDLLLVLVLPKPTDNAKGLYWQLATK